MKIENYLPIFIIFLRVLLESQQSKPRVSIILSL